MIDIAAAKRNYLQKKETNRIKNFELWQSAFQDASRIISLISAQYPVKKIYQWGSLLRQEKFDTNSDIDIAIEGIISPEIFFDLIGDCMKMTTFPLDIVQMEKIEPEYASLIRQYGKLVYEQIR